MNWSEDEYEGLMASGTSAKMKRESAGQPDWSRYGLSSEQQKENALRQQEEATDAYHDHGDPSEDNELFAQDQHAQSAPWWKANFLISEPVLFGTWDGVFTSCMINIFGVVIFLRTGWMVGNAGIGMSTLIILMTICVALVAALSAIGVCERCKMERGGVYFLLSHVLGARIGASVGILYCFGQAIACSLYVVGFGESISALLHQDNPWVSRGIAIGVVLLLLLINVAGVKWVIRLQLILLMVLFVAVLDFLVGSFVHTEPEHGVMGYTKFNLQNNTAPDYLEGESFFTVFGVFFPTATGVFAGINMSGDLQNPAKNIPIGTLSAVGVSTILYLSFAVVLGATCMRDVLQTDYMIAERVAITGVLFLAGLYISSISSSMGGLYGSPRILQTIALELGVPFLTWLGQGVSLLTELWWLGMYTAMLTAAIGADSGNAYIVARMSDDLVLPGLRWLAYTRQRGPNKVPVYALMVITFISLIFIMFGRVNTLAPIVAMPFMLTYAMVDYAYFALAMSFDKRKARENRFKEAQDLPATFDTTHKLNGSAGQPTREAGGYGTIAPKSSDDLDSLFPERRQHEDGRNIQVPRRPSMGSQTDVGAVETMSETTSVGGSEPDDTHGLLKKGPARPVSTEIKRQPRSFYSIFCNRWLSLVGALISMLIMFGIQWAYALITICLVMIIFIYIGQANPGLFPGIAEFSMYEWIRDGLRNCCRRGPPPPEQIVVTPNTPAMNTMAAQLTEDNEDFAERGRYHQSEIVKGDDFDDYDTD